MIDGQTKVLAIASSGGHWVQLMRLRSAWRGAQVSYATVDEENRRDVPNADFYTVPDGNIHTKLALIRMAWRVWLVVRWVRPDVVITTGAAPGYFALRFAKSRGARTVWVESIANAAKLSLSGRKVEPYADVWLTQWPELEQPNGPYFVGNVL
jgi:UDP-N-acetylglucosamine:LPS N-acetylglucosamine transferase